MINGSMYIEQESLTKSILHYVANQLANLEEKREVTKFNVHIIILWAHTMSEQLLFASFVVLISVSLDLIPFSSCLTPFGHLFLWH